MVHPAERHGPGVAGPHSAPAFRTAFQVVWINRTAPAERDAARQGFDAVQVPPGPHTLGFEPGNDIAQSKLP